MELIRDLHLYPMRAGMVSDPAPYRWSSHGEFLRERSEGGIAAEEGLERAIKRRKQWENIRARLRQGRKRQYQIISA